MSIEKRLEKIEKQNELILSLLTNNGASQMPLGESQGPHKKAPVKRQGKVKAIADFKTMYKKRGIV